MKFKFDDYQPDWIDALFLYLKLIGAGVLVGAGIALGITVFNGLAILFTGR